MRKLEIGKLTKEDEATLRTGKCPACGSEHFVKGPSGGFAVNIACENGHRYWMAGPFTPEYQGMIRVEHKGDQLEAWF